MENKIIERIELNTDEGKYIKCNACGRLSPEQKYCKYCFAELSADSETEVKSIYISRDKGYSPVADFSRMRAKIDSEFKASDIDFSSLGMTEDEYNLKFTPPTRDFTAEAYRTEASERFEDAYRRYEKKASEAYAAHKEEERLMRGERESVKQIISDTPTQTVFTAASGVEAESPASEKHTDENLTLRRESARFRLSLLSGTCFATNLLIIATLFIPFIGGAMGMDVVSLTISSLGATLRDNAWLTASAANRAVFNLTSAAYLLTAGLSLYQFLAFSICVLLDRKQKHYSEFVLSFTALLASIVVLFTLFIEGFALSDFVAGTIIFFVATAVNFIASTGKMLRE